MTDRQKTVVISGASRGIGQAIALRFMREGWRVITCARGPLPDGLDRLGDGAGDRAGDGAGERAGIWSDHVEVDIASRDGAETLVKAAKEILGGAPLDALVNNAGISPKTTFKERLGILNGPIDGWREVFELNFFAPLRLARGFAADLHKAKGAIVNVTSIAGHYVHPFAGSAYSTSKAALSGLTREMAAELAQLEIRVNAIAPGEIQTEMISPEYEALIPRIPLDRMGTPEDVAALAFRLCSEEFGYITGTEIFVTGGQHLY